MTGEQIHSVRKLAAEYPRWRAGQALFNACHSLFPEVANAARSTKADPFYDDSRIGAFYAHMAAYEVA